MEHQDSQNEKAENIVGGIIFQVTVWKNQLHGGREKQIPFLVFDTPDYIIHTKPVGYKNIKKYQ